MSIVLIRLAAVKLEMDLLLISVGGWDNEPVLKCNIGYEPLFIYCDYVRSILLL